IAVSYLSRGGWLYGRTRGHSHKNVLLRRAQYLSAEDIEGSLRIAQRLVRAKIKNGRTLIRRNATVDSARAELTKTLETVDRAESIEALLGLEGHAAAVYFRAFNGLLGERVSPCFEFQRRNRRPAQDPTNALLSLGYALLTTTWTETVERVGFDPYLGFYHQPRYGKPALALDLMEEFRPIVADSVVLNLIRRGTLSEEDFVRTRTSCSLSKAGRRRFIGAYERRLSEEVTHPVFGYRVSYRQVFEIQARLLARYLTGETSDFPEFTTR
ncbi:MAG: CRISPR-associated endonuclease Cas1, partial [Myxococcota bacterium]